MYKTLMVTLKIASYDDEEEEKDDSDDDDDDDDDFFLAHGDFEKECVENGASFCMPVVTDCIRESGTRQASYVPARSG